MDKRLIFLLPFISGIFWGSGGVFVRLLNSYGLNSQSILFSRLSLAVLILFIILMAYDKNLLKIKLKDIWLFIGSGILGVMLLNLSYNEAAFKVTLSLASVLLSLAPIFAMFLSYILFNEKITKNKILSLILAIIGCVFVSGVLESTINWSISGILFGLLSAFFWALYGVFSKIASKKGYSVFTIIFYSFLCCTIVLIPFFDTGAFTNFIMSNPFNNVPFAIIHTLFASILPYLLFTISLKYVDNGKATILCSAAEPSSASILGLIFFTENLTILNIIGIALTVIALSIIVNEEKK
ncbi:MAG: EamA family transporter [Methanosphaera stadtmanae]|nr:EamA family transporter [Methanosphaera stadtmanae]